MLFMLKNIKRKFYEKTEKSFLIKKAYLMLHAMRVHLEQVLPNETYAKVMYKRTVGKDLDLCNPITFDEKQWWIKFYYHNPLMTKCADKYRVREYIAESGLSAILNEIYMGGLLRAEDIDFEKLPNKFYIKTNHGCGGNICVDKSKGFDKSSIIKSINRSLKHNYFIQSREWPYKNIEPCIIVEKYLDSGSQPLLDYRFFCFSGECKYIFVDYDTSDEKGHHKIGAKRNIYSSDYKLLPYKVSRDGFDPSIAPKPENLKEMIGIAETLSKPFPFVRVDLYNIKGNIIFGEMTFFHAGACSVFEPAEFAVTMGDLITLPEKKL